MTIDTTPWQANTLANIQSARRKNGRLGSKKSRSGCATCKIRRVKCNEERPACKRCTDTGRKCDGYSTSSPPHRQELNNSPSLTRSLPGLDGDERIAFDYYVAYAGPRFAGVLDKSFWCDQVLPLCHSEPFVMDAVLALSTLYRFPQYLRSFTSTLPKTIPRDVKITKLKTGDPFGNLQVDKHHAAALNYYNRSIKRLNQRLAGGEMSPVLALLSCILFLAIELNRDNFFSAIDLCRKGISLVRNATDIDWKDSLACSLEEILGRLQLMTGGTGQIERGSSSPKTIDLELRESFFSGKEARSALYSLMSEAQRFAWDAAEYTSSLERERFRSVDDFASYQANTPRPRPTMSEIWEQECARMNSEVLDPGTLQNGKMRISPMDFGWNCDLNPRTTCTTAGCDATKLLPQLVKDERDISHKLGDWFDAFTNSPFLVEVNSGHSEVESLLLMYYHVSLIWFSTRLTPEQTAFDKYNHHFRQVLRYAEIYVAEKATESTNITFENGAVPPLYFVATKCRVPSLRRRAVKLLTQAPAKEGKWGAVTCAEIAATLAMVEEESLGLSPPHDLTIATNAAGMDDAVPPESDRVHSFEILVDYKSLSYSLFLNRRSRAEDGIWLKQEVEVPVKPLKTT